jgi:hypothetical protein
MRIGLVAAVSAGGKPLFEGLKFEFILIVMNLKSFFLELSRDGSTDPHRFCRVLPSFIAFLQRIYSLGSAALRDNRLSGKGRPAKPGGGGGVLRS